MHAPERLVHGDDVDADAGGAAPRRTRLPAGERREIILHVATEPVIFQNFGSKAALFAAVVERAAAEVRDSLDDLAGVFGSASGLLAHVLTGTGQGHPGGELAAAAYGVLFADVAVLGAEPALSEPIRGAVQAVASHLADLIRRAIADGEVRLGTDPDDAAWLLLSVLSARRLRAAAMPAGLESAVAATALRSIAP
jgi:AcrR family transcriptional regulator